MRKILIKIWQGQLTPRQAVQNLRRTGIRLDVDKEENVLELFSAIAEKQITVNEAEQTLREEGVEYEGENDCYQI